jgi:hypothetical protein
MPEKNHKPEEVREQPLPTRPLWYDLINKPSKIADAIAAGYRVVNLNNPQTGTGGVAFEHPSGQIAIVLFGTGEGLGDTYAAFETPDGTYFEMRVDMSGGVTVQTNALPISSVGLAAGTLWNDGGTVKIV